MFWRFRLLSWRLCSIYSYRSQDICKTPAFQLNILDQPVGGLSCMTRNMADRKQNYSNAEKASIHGIKSSGLDPWSLIGIRWPQIDSMKNFFSIEYEFHVTKVTQLLVVHLSIIWLKCKTDEKQGAKEMCNICVSKQVGGWEGYHVL
jgi:hypothetical protein